MAQPIPLKQTEQAKPVTPQSSKQAENEALLARLRWLCKDNVEAFQFCVMILDMVAIYDDIIDKDNVEHTDLQVHSMMHSALFGLPYNSFYQTNFALLNPIMLNSVANWRMANELEKTKALPDLHIAFIIRSSYSDILRMVAFIVGGDAHSIQAGIELRRYVHAEGMESYLKEQQGV